MFYIITFSSTLSTASIYFAKIKAFILNKTTTSEAWPIINKTFGVVILCFIYFNTECDVTLYRKSCAPSLKNKFYYACTLHNTIIKKIYNARSI